MISLGTPLAPTNAIRHREDEVHVYELPSAPDIHIVVGHDACSKVTEPGQAGHLEDTLSAMGKRRPLRLFQKSRHGCPGATVNRRTTSFDGGRGNGGQGERRRLVRVRQGSLESLDAVHVRVFRRGRRESLLLIMYALNSYIIVA
jgi:hypothetical protein